MQELRNWIERAIGKQWRWPPYYVGTRRGHERYLIEWADGSEGYYYIDFENQIIKAD